MTYLQFHFIFTLPPIFLLTYLLWRRYQQNTAINALPYRLRDALTALGVLCVIAFVYTTPWDNYLVANEVWGYGANRVLFTIAYVPIEEYLFFILQTIMTGLFFLYLYSFRPLARQAKPRAGWRILWTALWLLLASLGVLALQQQHSLYIGLIMAWAAPIVAIQCAFGADLLRQQRYLIASSLLIPTLYLWFADRIAIALGIWWISEAKTTGWHIWGLPVEEAMFFAMTNILVVFGLSLALHPQAMPRLQALREQCQRLWQRKPWQFLVVLWALFMIPIPLIPAAFVPLSYLSTLCLALAVLGYAWQQYGKKALTLFIVALFFGWVVEWLGKSTGFPFGAYDYAPSSLDLLGVPLLVPLGWWAFSMIAFAMSPARWLPLAITFFAPLVLVAWDVGLDPLMVHKGIWTFERGGYYGIPWTNFLGWYGAGVGLIALLGWLEPRLYRDRSLELRLIFYAQLFLLTIGLLFFGLYSAALVFFLAMAIVAFSARYAAKF